MDSRSHAAAYPPEAIPVLPHDISRTVLFLSPARTVREAFLSEQTCAFVCTDLREDGRPCRVCDACRKVRSLTHPDVIRTDGKTAKADDLKALCGNVAMAPHEADKTVYVFENFSDLNEQGQNTLLKFLEEPPAHAVILLTAPSKSGILPTVLSRTLILYGETRERDYYRSLARAFLPERSPKEHEDALCAYWETYEESAPASVLMEAFEAAEAYYAGEEKAVITRFPRKKEEKEEARIFFRVFQLYARNIAVYKATAGRAEVLPDGERFRKICTRCSVRRAVASCELFEKAYDDMTDCIRWNLSTNALFAHLAEHLL